MSKFPVLIVVLSSRRNFIPQSDRCLFWLVSPKICLNNYTALGPECRVGEPATTVDASIGVFSSPSINKYNK